MNIAILLSGGSGLRLGAAAPKQYMEAGGRPLFGYALECLSRHEGIDGIQIVADPAWQPLIRGWFPVCDPEDKFFGFSLPGENRQLSILHGLMDLKERVNASDGVLIHDAARPLLAPEQVSACLAALEGHDGVMPALPMKDTIYASKSGKQVSSLLKREEVFAGQAPEVFRFGKYYEANAALLPDRILQINGSTEPAIMAGMDIAMIPGDEGNYKITTPGDWERFQNTLTEGGEKDR